jgi:HEAT repeat protein
MGSSFEATVEENNTIIQQLDSPDEEVRRLAVVTIGQLSFQDGRHFLLKALGDPSWRVRKEAVDLVVSSPPDAAVREELIYLLRSSDNAGLRNSAVECLERLGTAAADVLEGHVADDDHDVRKFIVDIMGAIASPVFVPTLIKVMEDEDANVSAAAIENLGKIGAGTAVPALLAALEKPDVWRRYTILEALCRIGEPVPVSAIIPFVGENILKKAVYDACGVLVDEEGIPVLIQGLSERVRTAREAAALALLKLRSRLPEEKQPDIDHALSVLKGSPAIDGLLKSYAGAEGELKEVLLAILARTGDDRQTSVALEACRDERLRSIALNSFRTMGESAALTLRAAYADADDEQRCLILYVCAEVAILGVADLVQEGLGSSYPPLRRVAAEAVGRIGLPRFTHLVANLLDDPVDFVVDGAVSALKRLSLMDRDAVVAVIGPRASLPLASARLQVARLCGVLGDVDRLTLLTKDEDPQVRKEAVIALASLRLPSTIGHLQMALVDEDSDVRIAALDALGYMGGPELCESLGLALNDSDPWVSCAALRSMAKCCKKAALPAIMNILDKGEGVVLITALEALGEIGGDLAVSSLLRVLSHADEEVVKVAIEILAGLDNSWVEGHKDQMLAHPHWDVRSAYVRAVSTCLGAAGRGILQEALAAEHDALVRQQIEELLESH